VFRNLHKKLREGLAMFMMEGEVDETKE